MQYLTIIKQRVIKLSGLLLVGLSVASCGGGGGGDTTVPVTPDVIANDDNYSVDKNLVLNIPVSTGVLANDTGLTGLTFTLSLAVNPANGTLSLSNDGSFSYTPDTDFSGIDSFTYRILNGSVNKTAIVNIDVRDNNNPPLANANAYTVNEDVPLILDAASGLLGNDIDIDGNSLTAILEPGSGPNNGTLVLNSDGSLNYTPDADYHGSDSFSYIANDGSADSNIAAVNLTIYSLNDAPGFSAGVNQTILEDAGIQTVIGWATGMNTGAADESAQILTFNLTNDNNALFSQQPAIDATTGTLTYTPVADANGLAIVTVSLSDNGGTLNGGSDTSASQAFTINITAINDQPSFTKGADQLLSEDASAQSISGWATNIINGPANESGQNITGFNVTNDNNTLFSIQPAVLSNGTLTYTPAANANGTAVVSVSVTDDGGTANGGIDTSSIQTFNITINSVPDDPLITSTALTSALPNNTYNYDVNADDPDGEVLTYSFTSAPPNGMSINSGSGLISWIPANVDVGSYDVLITVKDTTNRTDTQSYTLTVGVSDNFGDGNDSGWSQTDDSQIASNWSVIGGEYTQTVYVEEITTGNPFDESYHLGTYSKLDAGNSLTNYRVNVDITPLLNNDGNAEGNDVGVMFRYQDNNNYYRFTTSARYGFSRLEKKVFGTFTTLALDSRGYTDQQLSQITIEVDGTAILIYLNNDPLFSVSDATFTSGTIALFSQDKVKFDNVLVEGVDVNPEIILSTPVAHSVEASSTLNVSAIAHNVPADGWVEFLLDGATSVIDSTEPYTGQFTSVSQGKHIVEAILHDPAIELDRDTNINIGVSGDYYASIGDSITNGIEDNYAADNNSADGSIISSAGFQANLVDLLTTSGAPPSIVFNDGIGGDKSDDTNTLRLASILERHTAATDIMVLLGTNDSSISLASGQGCVGAACNGTFKGNMQSIIDTINGDGKTAIIALVPPTWGAADPWNASRNILIREYNSVITNELSNRLIGPNFFAYFLDSGSLNRSSLFADNLHPNGLGYLVMAHLWQRDLNPGSPVALPFILENISQSTYKQNLLESGDTHYIDETFMLTTVPSALQDGRWIMTANGNKNNTSSNFLSFDLDRNADVYIAYDAGATSLPNWIGNDGFANTGMQITTTNPNAPVMDLYMKNFSASSTVSLDGNHASGFGGSADNYIVIVVEN